MPHAIPQLVLVELFLLSSKLPSENLVFLEFTRLELLRAVSKLADLRRARLHLVRIQLVAAELGLAGQGLENVRVMVFTVVGEELLDSGAGVLRFPVSLG